MTTRTVTILSPSQLNTPIEVKMRYNRKTAVSLYVVFVIGAPNAVFVVVISIIIVIFIIVIKRRDVSW